MLSSAVPLLYLSIRLSCGPSLIDLDPTASHLIKFYWGFKLIIELLNILKRTSILSIYRNLTINLEAGQGLR